MIKSLSNIFILLGFTSIFIDFILYCLRGYGYDIAGWGWCLLLISCCLTIISNSIKPLKKINLFTSIFMLSFIIYLMFKYTNSPEYLKNDPYGVSQYNLCYNELNIC